MDIRTQKKNAREFVKRWATTDRGKEKQDSQQFWTDLLENVLGVEQPADFIRFEKTVQLSHESFIDGYIDQTKVMIEQKGSNKDLNKPIKQSSGEMLTPFQQAKRYADNLPYSERPRWIVTCNFKEFYIYDMEHPNSEPVIIKLNDLEKSYYQLEFLVDKSNQHLEKEKQVSLDAGELVGKIYNELLKQYKDPDSEYAQKSINQLSVRLVFCLYAEDAGIFGKKNMFHDYLAQFDARGMRHALIELFKVLDTRVEDRDPYLEDDDPKLAEFPYVNGGMFKDEDIEIPPFTEELRTLLLNNASDDFDWSEISPTIFGSVFESTLNPDTRRQGGMHYTSVENIHKVIDPLFLDDLKNELNEIKKTKQPATLKKKASAFQDKLSHLTFFDPACGSGNFLTETYLSLRKLENEAIKLIYGDNVQLDLGQSDDIIKVTIQNFYGIEINDFAVSVAKTALWIAESQMLEETKDIFYADWDFLPLKTYTHIHEGNALRMDWNEVLPNYVCSYIMGNPPFIGGMIMSKEQKAELKEVIGKIKGVGELDYVSGWYKKALDYMQGTTIETAFVSTNSIVQGQQAVTLWKSLLSSNININFAYKTFIWDSEAKEKAHVHCVIISFSFKNRKTKIIYDESGNPKVARNINSYLMDQDNIFIESRSLPLNAPRKIRFGSMPRDGGGFILTEEEKDNFIENNPLSEKYIHPYLGAAEFLHNKKRYCLWLVDATPRDLNRMPLVLDRIRKVKEFRAKSKAASTRKMAETPTLFAQRAQPAWNTEYIAVPKTSSQRRRYIPIGFLSSNIVASDLLFLIPDATIYDFGILSSNVHNAWMRAVAGRLKSDYRYAKDIVYNNFPWPVPTAQQKQKIEKTAQAILDARVKYPDSSLADLYDELTMPPELRKAHQDNDRAVMEAYGMDIKTTKESDAVAILFKLYQKLTD